MRAAPSNVSERCGASSSIRRLPSTAAVWSKPTGDGLLVEFGSVVEASRWACQGQRARTGRNAGVPPDNRIEFRIGINVGDIVVEDGDIFADGVNVAARRCASAPAPESARRSYL